MKIDRGVFEKGVLKYFLAVKIDIKSQMTSSCLTFDLQYNHRIQHIQSLGTGHAHVQISGLYYEVNRNYTFFNERV